MIVDMCSRVSPLRGSLTLLRGHSFTRPCPSALLHRLGPSLLYAFARRGRGPGPPAFVSSPVCPPVPPSPSPAPSLADMIMLVSSDPGCPTARTAGCPQRPTTTAQRDEGTSLAPMSRSAQADTYVRVPGILRRQRFSTTSSGEPCRGQPRRTAPCWRRVPCGGYAFLPHLLERHAAVSGAPRTGAEFPAADTPSFHTF